MNIPFTQPHLTSKAFSTCPTFLIMLPILLTCSMLECNSLTERAELIKKLKENDILAVFYHLSLHCSEYYKDKHDGPALPECDRYADCLVRLPMYYDLSEKEEEIICGAIQ